ncbi:MAG TPA: lipid-binding SYLF domain-containing protein [Blastocatellia bacterium]|nr:lipid-binding SYLF domain-containing protein [Blastocatellia bacterium]
MKSKSFNILLAMVCASLILNAVVVADDQKDAAQQSTKAATVFSEVMGAPEKAIPQNILDKALCVLTFPKVIKGGFIFGGRYGRGVASCRTKGGWSAPAFFNLGGGSFGLQIGGQATDFILLFMNDEGMKSLLKNKFEMGGEASAAAGPVGREAGASTDLYLTSKILSYSRSKGIFAGLELKGAVLSQDDDNMRAIYGKDVQLMDVLQGGKMAPASVNMYPNMLTRYSGTKKNP